jgi:hypothetical protein
VLCGRPVTADRLQAGTDQVNLGTNESPHAWEQTPDHAE